MVDQRGVEPLSEIPITKISFYTIFDFLCILLIMRRVVIDKSTN